MKKYLIIGNGVAGTTAAEQIRKNDNQGEITILSDEDLPFYSRIRLNEYIGGDIEESSLVVRKPDWYTKKEIRVLTRKRIIEGYPDKKVVVAENKETFTYDALLVATGSSSFVPPLKGADKQGVFTLRTVNDARRIIDYCKYTENVVLIGGGLLGLEAGNALRRRGKKITVVEVLPRLLPRQLDHRGAGKLREIMEGMGFSFFIGVIVKEISGDDKAERVILESDETIPAQMVIVSAGVRPNLDLARSMGMLCNKGIIVDSSLRTNLPDVFAAGDVAEFDGRLYGIWPAAMDQGKVAGDVMSGGSMTYSGTVMSNILKVAGIDLASAGEIDADGRYESRIEETGSIYNKIVIHENRIIGCIMLGDTSVFASVMRMIKEGNEMLPP